MKRLSLEVETIAGMDMKAAFQDMIDLSEQLDMLIHANINGFDMLALPGYTADQMIKEYSLRVDLKK